MVGMFSISGSIKTRTNNYRRTVATLVGTTGCVGTKRQLRSYHGTGRTTSNNDKRYRIVVVVGPVRRFSTRSFISRVLFKTFSSNILFAQRENERLGVL